MRARFWLPGLRGWLFRVLVSDESENVFPVTNNEFGRRAPVVWSGTNVPETGCQFGGSPIDVVSQMPDVAPGSTPIAFENWKRTYLIVWRKAVSMVVDPYSVGFCTVFRFEATVGCGGATTCPNAARLLRIK